MRPRYGRAGESIVNAGIDDTAIEDAVAPSHSSFSIPGNIPSKADAGSKVIFVARETLSLRNTRIRQYDTWEHFIFVAQTQVQCEAGKHAPVILGEKSEVIGIERKTNGSECLRVAGIAGSSAGSAALVGFD